MSLQHILVKADGFLEVAGFPLEAWYLFVGLYGHSVGARELWVG